MLLESSLMGREGMRDRQKLSCAASTTKVSADPTVTLELGGPAQPLPLCPRCPVLRRRLTLREWDSGKSSSLWQMTVPGEESLGLTAFSN